jgi:predicted TPR repeat methyltransferase
MPGSIAPDTFERARRFFVDGNAAFAAGRLAEAEACFRTSLKALPGRPSTVANLALTLQRLGRDRDALALLDETLAAQPGEAALWSLRGGVLDALDQPAEALASHERALGLDPQRAQDHFHAGTLLLRLGRPQAALEALEFACADAAAPAAAHHRRGQALLALERRDEALAAWDRALALDPAFADAWADRGTLMHERGQDAEAVRCFAQARTHGADMALMDYQIAGLAAAGREGATSAAPPMPASAPRSYVQNLFDRYAADFDEHLVGQLGYRAPEELAGGLARLGRTHFRHALDLGCGTGLCAAPLGAFVTRLDGVDLSAGMLERARALGRYDRLEQADVVEHLAATPWRHDLVVAADLFIYVGRLEGVFVGVRRVLEPGGLFCFSVEHLDDAAGDCALLPSLRYAHSAAYVRRLAQAHGLGVAALQERPLRRDERTPVRGLYAWLSAP